MKSATLLLVIIVLNLLLACFVRAATPTVSNVSALQRPGTQLVDINYDVADPDSATLTVLVAISTNGGATYTLPGTTFTGAVGGGVSPGANKLITWNAGQDWPDHYSTNIRFRVVANDNSQPPNPDATKLIWIPPGTFQMGGSTDYSDDEVPITQVTISKGFWIGKFEVTQEDYEDVMGNNPSWFTDDPQLPVESVSWQDALAFCAAFNAQESGAGRLPAGCQYSLPTEAEWEYVCRAGTTTRFSFGDDQGCTTISSYAWYYDVSSLETHLVGQKLPNPWGLYDMHGNVWEWCRDWYSIEGYGGGSITDPVGAASGTDRVFRGGSFGNYCQNCRSANREYAGPSESSRFIGFRVALVQVATGVSSESNITTVDTRTPSLCTPGELFANVLLPEVLLDIPIAKVAQLKLRFAPLGLNFTVVQPDEIGVRCKAQSNIGTLTMLVRRLPFVGQIPFVNEDWVIGYSTAQATVTLFHDGRVRWQTPGFEVVPSIPTPFVTTFCSIGAIEEWLTASDLGFSPLATPFELTVRQAEDFMHRKLSNNPEILSCLRFFVLEDPGQTDLLVTAPTGEQTGITVSGNGITNISGSAYFASVPLVFVLNPAQGNYQTEVRGRLAGSYQLVAAYADSARTLSQQSFDGSLDVGQSVTHITIVPPNLNIILTGTNVLISWPLPADGFVLESTDSLKIPFWTTVPSVTTNSVILPANLATRFYRLRR